MPHRLLLSGLAIGPALAAVTLPLPVVGSALTLAIGGATGVYALVSSVRVHDATAARRRDSLLHPATRLPGTAPDPARMRQALARLLARQDAEAMRGFPIDRRGAIARVLQRFLDAWNASSPEALTLDELSELWLLSEVLHALPGDAGRMAQMFRDPAAILALRDEVDRLARQRAVFDRDHSAFLATRMQWDRSGAQPVSSNLLMALQALKVPDIDLWHRIVLEHDPRDAEQRAAALWCLQQKQCDRATVAAYLAFAAAEGRLQAAARSGDEVYLNAVQDIIERWNAGFYRGAELALDPIDAVAQEAPRLTAALDDLAAMTGGRRWPDPHGVFADYPGRKPRLRANWSLREGRLTAPPEMTDYVDVPAPPRSGAALHN